MTVVVNGFHVAEQLPLIQELSKKYKRVWHISVKHLEQEERSNIPSIQLLFWEDLYYGKNLFPVIASLENEPDAQMLNEFAVLECIVLKMMDRQEFARHWSYQERKSRYLDWLRFWLDWVSREQPDIYISQNVPHEVFDYILYEVLKKKGIPTLMFYQSQLKDTILPMRDYREGPLGLSEALSANKDRTPILPEYLQKDLQAVLNRQMPFYMRKTGFLTKGFHTIQKGYSWLRRALFSKNRQAYAPMSEHLRALLRRRDIASQTKKMWKGYRRLCKRPDFTTPYIYLPLHYQPELTTCPLAGPWVDQDLMANLLANTASRYGLSIYIKEHPKQSAISRPADFYQRLTSMPNVRLVPTETDSFTLSDAAIAVATCTGTAGWEALVRGKPVLVFGSIFYEKAPGAYSITKQEELNTALESICRNLAANSTATQKSNEQSQLHISEGILRFVAALEQCAINGIIDPVYSIASETNVKKSTEALSEYITRFIQQECGESS